METYFGAIIFPDLDGAGKFHKTLKNLEKEELIELEDAVIVTKDQDGKTDVKQTQDLTPGKGAAKLGVVGFVAGLLLGGPVGGALLGALAGALLGKKVDLGIPDDQIKAIKGELTEDTSLLFVQVRSLKEGVLRRALDESDGTVHDVVLTEERLVEVHEHLGHGGMYQNTM